MLFDDVIAAEANGLHVISSIFVKFDFRSTPIYVWEGDGPLEIFGTIWDGFGLSPLVQVTGLELNPDGKASKIKFTLSGVDQRVLAAVLADQNMGEIEGRDVTVYLAFLDDKLEALSSLLTLGNWIMQKPEFEYGGRDRSVGIVGETVFAQRNKAPNGLLTDRDQQRRYPGDKGLEGMYLLRDRVIKWPSF